jgi:hypothetical protein
VVFDFICHVMASFLVMTWWLVNQKSHSARNGFFYLDC